VVGGGKPLEVEVEVEGGPSRGGSSRGWKVCRLFAAVQRWKGMETRTRWMRDKGREARTGSAERDAAAQQGLDFTGFDVGNEWLTLLV
jgi:hypothetical protein